MKMKLEKPENSNYAAIIAKVDNIVTLDNCSNVQAAIILGNQVIVSKDIQKDTIGIYFPLECALSKEYMAANNLHRDSTLNLDQTKKGYFETNGRVRCQKFRGNKSEGLFMPLDSLSFLLCGKISELQLRDEFDKIEGVNICKKYVVKDFKTAGAPGSKKGKGKVAQESKLVEGQFKFHDDTSMLYKNLHRINSNSIIHISYKMHGTSGISSYILCKKKLNWFNKILLKLGVNIETQEYDYIYSSRKVIKNEELNPNAQHYYGEDIWGIAHNELEPFLQKGMTFYYEIVGFLPNGGAIQKDYDYGCDNNEHKIFIYRITQTNADGKVTEYSARMVQEFCKKNGLNAVPELYYGYAHDLTDWGSYPGGNLDEIWRTHFLNKVKELYNEKDCFICKNKVPEEGCVIRLEKLEFEAYKQKSERFYERETKLLDKGEIDIESEN